MEGELSPSSAKAHFVAAGAGEPLRLRTAGLRVKSSAKTSKGTLTCVETTDPPGFVAPVHIHHGASEAFYILEGTYMFHAGEETTWCETGTFCFVPPGLIHGYEAGDGGGRLLILYFPAGIDDMWREMQTASANGQLPDGERDEIGRRHGTEWPR